MDKSAEQGGRHLSWAKVGQAAPVRGCCVPGQTGTSPTWLCHTVLGDDIQRSRKMLSLDGLEMIAVLVVMGLFIKVLEQFGMFEPVGGEGN